MKNGSLTDVSPNVSVDEMVRRFVPPDRFAGARFATYHPDPTAPKQAVALAAVEAFSSNIIRNNHSRGLLKRKKTTDDKRAVYIDGSYGTGKTHLLAALWHATHEPKTYLSFAELTAFIGYVGIEAAGAAFARQALICIDEFELDDVANTLMVVSLLRRVIDNGSSCLAVTSNTLPERLGEQRFSSEDFRREIAAIADYFIEIPIDGSDYRRSVPPSHLPPPDKTERSTATFDGFDALIAHLRMVHPASYGWLLDGVVSVHIDNMHEIENQGHALLFVQFVDRLYDARIPVAITGCSPEEVFSKSYRNGGYRKKYGRAESRLEAMRTESL